MAEAGMSRYISEFLGTFFLVFTVGCNVLSGQPVWAGISIACVLMVMVYSLAQVSGANFNPAVSIALGIAKKLETPEVCKYIVCQLLGGVCGALGYVGMFGQSFNLEPVKGHTWIQAGMAEFFYTAMLCFVVLNTAASKEHGGKNQFFGLAIGFTIVAAAYSGGAISMGCFNPAVAAGIDISSAYYGVKWCLPYAIFEILGACFASGLFLMMRPEDQDENSERAEEYSLTSCLIAEGYGTFMLVLTVGLNVLSGSAAGAFSCACALMCLIFAVGTVSGGHLNPAVTVALMGAGRGKFNSAHAPMYMVTQVAAAILAAFTYSTMQNGDTFGLKPPTTKWYQAVIAELAFTFVLTYVVLSVATVKKSYTEYFGFLIGMCVTVGGCAIGKISGGALNPAVAIGIATSYAPHGGWTPALVQMIFYTIAEVAAGGLAAGVFRMTHPSEFDGLSDKQEV